MKVRKLAEEARCHCRSMRRHHGKALARRRPIPLRILSERSRRPLPPSSESVQRQGEPAVPGTLLDVHVDGLFVVEDVHGQLTGCGTTYPDYLRLVTAEDGRSVFLHLNLGIPENPVVTGELSLL